LRFRTNKSSSCWCSSRRRSKN